MNYFDKNKILTAAVVLLLILNLGILGLLWFDRSDKMPPPVGMPPGERKPPPGGMPPSDRMTPDGGPKEFLIRELNFSEKQKQDYGKLVEEHRADTKRIRDKVRIEKDSLRDLYSKPGTDTSAAVIIATEIGKDQKEMELINFRHFQKVRDLCDDGQKKKFDEVIKEALRMMGSSNPPPAPR